MFACIHCLPGTSNSHVRLTLRHPRLVIPFSRTPSVRDEYVRETENQGFERRDEVSEAYDLYSFDSYDHCGLAGGIWGSFVPQR